MSEDNIAEQKVRTNREWHRGVIEKTQTLIHAFTNIARKFPIRKNTFYKCALVGSF